MLGPVLVCHKKDKKAIKLLCDILLDIWPGQAENLMVLGADGKRVFLTKLAIHFLLQPYYCVCVLGIWRKIFKEICRKMLQTSREMK